MKREAIYRTLLSVDRGENDKKKKEMLEDSSPELGGDARQMEPIKDSLLHGRKRGR